MLKKDLEIGNYILRNILPMNYKRRHDNIIKPRLPKSKMNTPIGGEFIRLIRGNPNKLEGRVISFSRMKDKELIRAGAPGIFAIFATNNIETYIKKVTKNKEEADYLRGVKRKIDEQIRRKWEGESLNGIYSSQMIINKESEIYTGEEDVVHNGDYFNPFYCTRSVNFGTNLYFSIHDEQNMNLMKKGQEYTRPERSTLKEEILRNFIFPLIDSYKHNDIASARTIKESMMQAYGGSSMANPLIDILKIVDQQRINPNMKAINLNLDEAQAIRDERFEDAARIRDEIKRLKG